MAFSWQESVAAAGTQNIQCDIEYLDKSYIHVYLDGQETSAFTWTSATNIRLNTPLPSEAVILLIRKTEREYLYIEFAAGAPFIEGNVDTQNTQFLHLAQELVEGRSIEGFYGDINMHRYRITNLGDPVDARDAVNKQYVDAGDARLDQRIDAEHAAWVAAVENEASIRRAADDALDVRTTNLEQTYFNANTNSFPWWTVLTVATDTVTPGMPFTKAKVRINGVTQTAGYSYSITAGVIKFASVLPAGTLVDCTIGIDTDADTSAVSEVFELLAKPSGGSRIGHLEYSADIRGISTDVSEQAVVVKRAVAGGPVIRKELRHVPGLVANDDGYRTFVAADGSIYQYDVSRGVDFALGGVLANGANAGNAIKTIVDGEVAKVIAAGSLDAGKKVVDVYPLNNEDSGELQLDTPTTLVLPSFMSIKHHGPVRYKFSGLSNPAFRICNEIPGLTSSMSDFVDIQGATVLGGTGYLATLSGPNPLTYSEWAATGVNQRSAAAGIEFGNTYSAPALLDCRDTVISDIAIRGFKAGLQWHGFDTYINTFNNLNLVSNEYSFYAPTADKSNSGEKIVFNGGVAGNCFRSHFYWNQVGMSMTFRDWSFDYAKENVIELRSSGRGNDFIFESCWFEGWGGFLVRQYPITDTWSYRKNRFVWSNSKIVGAKTSQSEWAPRRKIILAPTDNNTFEFLNTPIEWPSPPSEPYIALMGYTDDTIKYNRSRFVCPLNPYEDELLNYANGLNGDGYKFSGTPGVSVKNAIDTATGISFDTNNNAPGFTVVYGGIDSDGLQSVAITTTATTDLVELSNRKLMIQAAQRTVVNAGLSIMMDGVTAGSVTFGTRLRAYNNPVMTANLSTGVVTTAYTLNGSLASDSYNVSSLLTAVGTPLTPSAYVGVQTSRRQDFANTVATHFVPTITLTGFVGTIHIKLPVWWVSEGTNAGYSIKGA